MIREDVVAAIVEWKLAGRTPADDVDGSHWGMVDGASLEELVECLTRVKAAGLDTGGLLEDARLMAATEKKTR